MLFIQKNSVGMISLHNILKALSVCFKDMGYCQGLNFLAAGMLFYMSDEDAFWMLNSLMVNYDCLAMYKKVDTVHKYCFVFSKLLENFLPKVHKKLKE